MKNAPATIQHAMDVILASVKWNHATSHIHDIIIFSNTEEEHLKLIEKVPRLLKDAEMTTKV